MQSAEKSVKPIANIFKSIFHWIFRRSCGFVNCSAKNMNLLRSSNGLHSLGIRVKTVNWTDPAPVLLSAQNIRATKFQIIWVFRPYSSGYRI